jgi:metallo-beta-lactamase class B
MKKFIILIIITLVIPIVSKSESTIYNSESLIVQKITENVYQHISYLDTESWGKVACNGMIYIVGNEAVVFDTTPDDSSSSELIEVIKNKLNAKVRFLVINHFHRDCIGGIKSFVDSRAEIIANTKTIALAKKEFMSLGNMNFRAVSFNNEFIIDIGDRKVINKFFGEGHTADNIISYLPSEKAMFGGCLIKEIGAGKGNLADANVNEWSKSVKKVKLAYPEVQFIIPGHGKYGGVDLLDYTIKMFE